MTTQFDNLTDAALADEIGALDREAKALKERLDAAKAEFKARGLDKASGEKFSVTRSAATRWSLDAKGIRAEMGEAWADARSKLAHVVSLRIGAAA